MWQPFGSTGNKQQKARAGDAWCAACATLFPTERHGPGQRFDPTATLDRVPTPRSRHHRSGLPLSERGFSVSRFALARLQAASANCLDRKNPFSRRTFWRSPDVANPQKSRFTPHPQASAPDDAIERGGGAPCHERLRYSRHNMERLESPYETINLISSAGS